MECLRANGKMSKPSCPLNLSLRKYCPLLFFHHVPCAQESHDQPQPSAELLDTHIQTMRKLQFKLEEMVINNELLLEILTEHLGMSFYTFSVVEPLRNKGDISEQCIVQAVQKFLVSLRVAKMIFSFPLSFL